MPSYARRSGTARSAGPACTATTPPTAGGGGGGARRRRRRGPARQLGGVARRDVVEETDDVGRIQRRIEPAVEIEAQIGQEGGLGVGVAKGEERSDAGEAGGLGG